MSINFRENGNTASTDMTGRGCYLSTAPARVGFSLLQPEVIRLSLILAIRVTLQTVIKITDVLFLVFLGNLSLVVANVTAPLL